MNPLTWRLVAFPLLGWPTRHQIEANCGRDPEKLTRLSAHLWKMFRATAIGSLAGWLMIVGLLGGLALVTGEPVEWRLVEVATAAFGTVVLVNYPWPFRDQGSQWVRGAVLLVGVPSVGLFVALLFGLA